MQKIKKIAFVVGLAAYFILISAFVSGKRDSMLCNKVNVVIADSASKRFLDKHDIVDLLGHHNMLSLGQPISEVNTDKIERVVFSNSLIKHCKVYTNIAGELFVEISQREPVVRIIDKKQNNYYLDLEGSVIAMSNKFTPHLLVVNGYISTPFNSSGVENIFDRKFDGKANTLRDIHQFALYLKHHSFWNAQIEQLYVNKSGEYEMIPRVGPHLIELGAMDNFEEKLEKLKIFYEEGLNNVGWNHYLKINLKYKDQIVCSKI